MMGTPLHIQIEPCYPFPPPEPSPQFEHIVVSAAIQPNGAFSEIRVSMENTRNNLAALRSLGCSYMPPGMNEYLLAQDVTPAWVLNRLATHGYEVTSVANMGVSCVWTLANMACADARFRNPSASSEDSGVLISPMAMPPEPVTLFPQKRIEIFNVDASVGYWLLENDRYNDIGRDTNTYINVKLLGTEVAELSVSGFDPNIDLALEAVETCNYVEVFGVKKWIGLWIVRDERRVQLGRETNTQLLVDANNTDDWIATATGPKENVDQLRQRIDSLAVRSLQLDFLKVLWFKGKSYPRQTAREEEIQIRTHAVLYFSDVPAIYEFRQVPVYIVGDAEGVILEALKAMNLDNLLMEKVDVPTLSLDAALICDANRLRRVAEDTDTFIHRLAPFKSRQVVIIGRLDGVDAAKRRLGVRDYYNLPLYNQPQPRDRYNQPIWQPPPFPLNLPPPTILGARTPSRQPVRQPPVGTRPPNPNGQGQRALRSSEDPLVAAIDRAVGYEPPKREPVNLRLGDFMDFPELGKAVPKEPRNSPSETLAPGPPTKIMEDKMVEAMLPFDTSLSPIHERDTSAMQAPSKPHVESSRSTSMKSTGVGTNSAPEEAVKPKLPPMNGRVHVGDWAKKSLGDWSTLAEDDDDAVPDDWFEAAEKNAGVEDDKAKNEEKLKALYARDESTKPPPATRDDADFACDGSPRAPVPPQPLQAEVKEAAKEEESGINDWFAVRRRGKVVPVAPLVVTSVAPKPAKPASQPAWVTPAAPKPTLTETDFPVLPPPVKKAQPPAPKGKPSFAQLVKEKFVRPEMERQHREVMNKATFAEKLKVGADGQKIVNPWVRKIVGRNPAYD